MQLSVIPMAYILIDVPMSSPINMWHNVLSCTVPTRNNPLPDILLNTHNRLPFKSLKDSNYFAIYLGKNWIHDFPLLWQHLCQENVVLVVNFLLAQFMQMNWWKHSLFHELIAWHNAASHYRHSCSYWLFHLYKYSASVEFNLFYGRIQQGISIFIADIILLKWCSASLSVTRKKMGNWKESLTSTAIPPISNIDPMG